MALLPRQFVGNTNNNNQCVDSFGNVSNCHSSWTTWGRWVAVGVILVLFFLFFFICSCITARRRNRAGRQPFYGTGWAAHGQPTYNPNAQSQQPNYNQYNHSNAPPAYGGQNQGYYGGQETGTEMQPPQNVYRGDTNGYQPPMGPPPTKKEGVY